MTKKHYINDAYTINFTANIEQILEKDNYFLIKLDQTYFYPEGGGQPSDKGLINNSVIYDVQFIDDKIYHFSKTKPLLTTDVLCKIDWNLRFDLMQQHTGQHILSSAFEKLFDANTIGFHLSDDYVTIDLDKKLNENDILEVENLSNKTITKNIPIIVHYPNEIELNMMPLRKPPKVSNDIRIIEIKDFDFSPCGGTHVNFTGEIGMIKIKKFENHKSGIRIEFICGNRALIDYQLKNKLLYELALDLSIKPLEILTGYENLKEEMKTLRTQVKNLNEQLIDYKIEELKSNAIDINGTKVISYEFEDFDMHSIKKISSTIINEDSYITLFTLVSSDIKILFARSKNVDVNIKNLIKTPLQLINGRGGGSQFAAQGGGSNINASTSALENAIKHLNSL